MTNRDSKRAKVLPSLEILLMVVVVVVVPAVAAEAWEMVVAFEHGGDPVYRVLPPGRIPAIDEPDFLRGTKADEQMTPEEPVLGVVWGDEARAFSLWQLDHHEIVNDRIGKTAIAATW